jgi:peptide deformylase
MLDTLPIVQIGDPVLRREARALTKEEILSPQVQELIAQMKKTMSGTGVGLAAPQVGYSVQLIVIEDLEEYLTFLTPQQILERERRPIPLHVIINPRLTCAGEETRDFYEGCLSVPELRGVVTRARSVRVDCLDERGEPRSIFASGWYARILQHECDHLRGTLCLDCVQTRTLSNEENYLKILAANR